MEVYVFGTLKEWRNLTMLLKHVASTMDNMEGQELGGAHPSLFSAPGLKAALSHPSITWLNIGAMATRFGRQRNLKQTNRVKKAPAREVC